MIVFFVLCSCTTNTQEIIEEPVKKNYLKVANVEYELESGILENYGVDNGTGWFSYNGFNTELTLISKGVNYNSEVNDIEGKGHGIYFDLFSSNGTVLDEMIYSNTEETIYPIGSYNYSAAFVNFDDTHGNNEYQEIKSGTVSVRITDGEYTIEIVCKTDADVAVTAYFKGALTYFDVTIE